ncbi:MAG: PorV/PorQ family protein [candidate division Zixibacteria bacterium]|nr:PorV/PorQ family protein [candidate division Zixibacteria bacterium]
MRVNRSKTLFNLVLLFCLLANSAFGTNNTIHTSAFFDPNGPGSTAGNFLKIGIGAKAGGMGSAFVGLADDPSAIFWNPAGLSQLGCSQVMFVHNLWAQDIRYEYLGYALPIDPKNTVAVAFMFLHMGEILGYDENDKPTSFFSAYDAAMLLGYSRKISSHLSLGWTAKGILEKLEDQKAEAVAFDMGLFYDSHTLSFGLSLRNLGTKLKFIEKEYPLPTDLKVGIAFKALNNHLLLSTDIDFLTDTSPGLQQGIEYNFQNVLFIRSGVEYKTRNQSFGSSTIPAIGGGIRISKFQFDYTYSSVKSLGDLHNFSLIYRFASE